MKLLRETPQASRCSAMVGCLDMSAFLALRRFPEAPWSRKYSLEPRCFQFGRSRGEEWGGSREPTESRALPTDIKVKTNKISARYPISFLSTLYPVVSTFLPTAATRVIEICYRSNSYFESVTWVTHPCEAVAQSIRSMAFWTLP